MAGCIIFSVLTVIMQFIDCVCLHSKTVIKYRCECRLALSPPVLHCKRVAADYHFFKGDILEINLLFIKKGLMQVCDRIKNEDGDKCCVRRHILEKLLMIATNE